jgi:hypothetical protein
MAKYLRSGVDDWGRKTMKNVSMGIALIAAVVLLNYSGGREASSRDLLKSGGGCNAEKLTPGTSCGDCTDKATIATLGGNPATLDCKQTGGDQCAADCPELIENVSCTTEC